MKTIWTYSEDTQARRILHSAHQIANHFYRINGFYVVPTTPSSQHADQAVVFPQLEYETIPRFWHKANTIDISSFPLIAPDSLITSITRISCLPQIDYQDIQNRWEQAKTEILDYATTLIPQLSHLQHIVIYPTTTGTTLSFNRYNPNEAKIYMYVRMDTISIAKIAEGVISAATRSNSIASGHTWSESEAIVDWILTQSGLSQIVNKYSQTPYTPTLEAVRTKQGNGLQKTSSEYMKTLGITNPTQLLTIENDQILATGTRIKKLNPTEQEILKRLITRQSLTSDEVATIMFDSDDDYSLYAMAKAIQRLRDKLEVHGISGSIIQTIRGKGYYLQS